MTAKHWTENRLAEPSTHTAIAVLVSVGALLMDSASLDGNPLTPWLLGWACVHALAGIFLKEGKGLV